jgi:hypothetical protein
LANLCAPAAAAAAPYAPPDPLLGLLLGDVARQQEVLALQQARIDESELRAQLAAFRFEEQRKRARWAAARSSWLPNLRLSARSWRVAAVRRACLPAWSGRCWACLAGHRQLQARGRHLPACILARRQLEGEALHLQQLLEQERAAAHEQPPVPEALQHAGRESLLGAYRQLHGGYLREARKGAELAAHLSAAHRLQQELSGLQAAHSGLQEAHELQVGAPPLPGAVGACAAAAWQGAPAPCWLQHRPAC